MEDGYDSVDVRQHNDGVRDQRNGSVVDKSFASYEYAYARVTATRGMGKSLFASGS